MRGAIPPLSQYVFMAWWLVKHRDNFTFTLPLGVNGRTTLIYILEETLNEDVDSIRVAQDKVH
jgi:hypothetical protein